MRCRKSVAAAWLIFACWSLSASGAETKKKGDEKGPEKAIQALLVTGGASHEYDVRKDIITQGIRERVSKKIEWMVRLQGEGKSDAKISLFESPTWADGYDIVVHDYCFPRVWDTTYVDRVLAPHRGGIPAVLLHGTMHSFRTGDTRWFDFCGVTSRCHDKDYPLTIIPKTPLSPIWGGLDTWMTPAGQLYLVEEVSENAKVLGTALARGSKNEHAVVWQHRYGSASARVFGMTPGNDLTTLVQPEYLDVLARGFLWALDESDKDGFKEIAPEASLSGFTLPIPPSDLPAVGAHALTFASASIAMPGELVASSPWDGKLAVDRDSGTSWIPEKVGPAVWQGELKRSSSVSALAIVWDNPPAQYALSTSVDGIAWDTFGPPALTTGTLDDPAVLHEMPARDARWVRVDVLKSGGGAPSGIREVGAYQRGSDVPAEFRIDTRGPEAVASVGEVPLSLDDNRVEHDFLLNGDWRLDAMAALSPDTVVKSITTKASDSAFLLVSSTVRKDDSLEVLHCHREGDELKWSTFLEGVSPQSVIGWDGEWLYVLDGSAMGLYRDTNGDGIADERHSQPALFSEEMSDLDKPVNRVFHEMIVAPDGWIYASFSQDHRSEAFCSGGRVLALPENGILRFSRDSDMPELAVSSRSKINSFIVDKASLRVVSSEPSEGLFLLPSISAGLSSLETLGDIIPVAIARGWREKSWLEISDDSVSEVRDGVGEVRRTSVASIPGIQLFSMDGLNNGWFVRSKGQGDQTQLGVISREEKVRGIELDLEPTADLVESIGEGTPRQQEALFLELLRRKRIPTSEIEAILNDPEREISARVLALRLLADIDKEQFLNGLVKWAHSGEPPLRKVAFDLLGNLNGAGNNEVFSMITEETDPTVTAAILASIFRSGSDVTGLDKLVLKMAATPEPEVALAALAFLIRRKAVAACFEALDDAEKNDLWPVAFEVLAQTHRQTVVEGLGGRLARTTDPGFRALCLSALCRLYASPSGGTWEASGFVGSLLRASISDRRVNKARLLDQMVSLKIPLQPSPLVNLAKEDKGLEPFVVDWLMTNSADPEDAPWLREITISDSRDTILKRKALIGLAGIEDGEIYLSVLDSILEALEEASWIGDNRGLLERRWRENPIRSAVVEELVKVTKGSDHDKSRLAWEPLLLLRDDLKGGGKGFIAVVERIDEVLFSKKDEIKPMLLAMKRVSSFEFPRALAVIESGNDEALKPFVEDLGKNVNPSTAWSVSFTESDIEHFLADTRAIAGDPEAGYEWFKRSGCSACHNIHGEGPSVGPNFAFETEPFELTALFESVTDPAAKGPESFVLHTFEMRDGTRLHGANVERENDQISLIDTAGNRVSFLRAGVHREWTQADSLMPRIGDGTMKSRDLADLKAFLDSLVAPGLTTNEVN